MVGGRGGVWGKQEMRCRGEGNSSVVQVGLGVVFAVPRSNKQTSPTSSLSRSPLHALIHACVLTSTYLHSLDYTELGVALAV